MSINSIYPNLWAPTAGLLQALTVTQHCVYQMKFRNVCEVKKRLVKPGLVWSKTYWYCCQWMEKASPCLCSHSWPTLQAILLQAVKKWTAGWNISQSVRNVILHVMLLSNHITLDKKVIFRWLCFPQVVQKQMLSEMKNWMVIWWQVVSEILVPKIIKIW